MKKYRTILLISITSLCLILSCDNLKKEDKREITASKSIVVPTFNADSAYVFVKNQVDFGPRVPNTPEHFACGNHLIKQLESYGAVVIVQEFKVKAYDNTILNLRNIIGSFNPRAKKRILLAAHWDTRPFADREVNLSASLEDQLTDSPIDGANDGASGVGVLLEIARLINTHSLQYGVDIIFFDGEDYGQPNDETPRKKDTWCLGSQYWARNLHKKDYYAKIAILLDMVGAKGAKFAMEGTSRHFAPGVVKKVWSTANRLGY
ncbi:MAG: M28 family peptidase, partial [Bacteroidetes bacterium]|nr:M28 family peptidase [Bacteroidota bacterium]